MSIEQQYRTRAKELLSAGEVKMVIGYGAGTTAERRRPIFITSPDETERLVLDSACIANLSGYLVTEGLLSDEKRVAVFLRPEGIRALNVLAAEAQLDPLQVVIIGFDLPKGELKSLQGSSVDDFTDLLGALKESTPDVDGRELLEKIEKMSPEERFAFWQEEFSKCIKCYACRQACPMCYCRRCIVDSNQPQWVNTSSHTLGNFEWNIVRAFHLSGRCVECGNCDRACPVNIPLRLINRKMAQEVLDSFNHFAGTSKTQEPVLASFKKDDSETFIL
ncbi:4Fe-4S dicluster domain-containing protein [Chlorobium ferrooxidans]|uniref:4Fe-4S ferredoxin, iron-sulfur binding n=1 Tax=Chlorobium ferrooxidans DSM 13031 TaxID=377431 RepID=Q0YQG7_9CHLB|nr:4Fe-4S dicluster domain-containing protein [Chlorobium ferrooxidans]EAT58543.1 4Fe-4S ferredoxin, iron-sulfur binding [Chlorobium ferrooxidans DSM 13031]